MLRFDIEIFRIDATHVICTSFLSSHYIILSAPLHNHRRKIAHSFHTLADRLQVAVAHLPVTPFLIPFVGFAGPFGKEECGVRRKTVDVLQHAILKTVAGTQQDNQHQDAPEHTEAGQQATGFITGDRHPYFHPAIYIKYEHNLSIFNYQLFIAHGLDRRDLDRLAGREIACQHTCSDDQGRSRQRHTEVHRRVQEDTHVIL